MSTSFLRANKVTDCTESKPVYLVRSGNGKLVSQPYSPILSKAEYVAANEAEAVKRINRDNRQADRRRGYERDIRLQNLRGWLWVVVPLAVLVVAKWVVG